MGALQPGLPGYIPSINFQRSPPPHNWFKRLLFMIPLHPDDRKKNSLSLCLALIQEPHWRDSSRRSFHKEWTAVPIFVRILWSKVQLYYIPWSSNISLYGDILLAYPDAITVAKIYAHLADHTNRVGLQIAPKRVQKMEPWKYLDYIITQRHI